MASEVIKAVLMLLLFRHNPEKQRQKHNTQFIHKEISWKFTINQVNRPSKTLTVKELI